MSCLQFTKMIFTKTVHAQPQQQCQGAFKTQLPQKTQDCSPFFSKLLHYPITVLLPEHNWTEKSQTIGKILFFKNQTATVGEKSRDGVFLYSSLERSIQNAEQFQGWKSTSSFMAPASNICCCPNALLRKRYRGQTATLDCQMLLQVDSSKACLYLLLPSSPNQQFVHVCHSEYMSVRANERLVFTLFLLSFMNREQPYRSCSRSRYDLDYQNFTLTSLPMSK